MSIADEVKQRLDIYSVVSEYMRMEKSGRNYRGLCPFHPDKNPSFFVFPERQSWRCFGCGAGGDLISFVMKQEGLDFGRAVKELAQRAGISMPEKRSKTYQDEKAEKLYRINGTAAQYFHEQLLGSPAGQTPRDYIKKRQLSQEIVKEFQLGFSLNEWDGLKQYLAKQGYEAADVVEAGLAIEKEGRIYDRFRGRLMFPIHDIRGRVAGFGARALDDSQPKYLNSAESPIFSKSNMLYGLHRAKEAIRRQGKAVIVEGYMDALTAHQNSFFNVVASMGTALTEGQVTMFKGLTTHICLALDPDAAGDAATLRGIEVCRQALTQKTRKTPNWLGSSESHARIDIISLPEGKDPDEMIREKSEEWQRLSDEAEPLMDYLLKAVSNKFDLSRPEGKSQASEQLLPLISEMEDSIEREVYLGKLAHLVGLSERTLAGIAARLHTPKRQRYTRKQPEIKNSSEQARDHLEEYCLYLLLTYPELKDMAGELSPEHFERSENREAFVAWKGSSSIDDIWEKMDATLHEHLQNLINKQQPPLDRRGQEKALTDCINRLEGRRLRSHLVYEGESGLRENRESQERLARLTELQRRHAMFDRR